MTKTVIREDEWLAALERASGGTRDGMTCAELAAIASVGVVTMRKMIGAAIARGRLVCAGKALKPSIDGAMRPTPIYRIVKREKRG